jgi:predicted nucleic acid-binding protein
LSLASLIVAKADSLVTGNADLLALRNEYRILKPTELAERL